MANILVIDDDVQILKVIKLALEREQHHVVTLTTTKNALNEARSADLILLDVMMPDEDGFRFCQRIRDLVDCPILFVTAKVTEQDILTGLGIGADDYIQKPFSIKELRARVMVHLRREQRGHNNSINVGAFQLDLKACQIFYQKQQLDLTKSQYLICAQMMQHPGQTFTKTQLFEAVFGYDSESDESVIVEHIKNIRAKFKKVGAEPIETVWGIGYRWQKEQASL